MDSPPFAASAHPFVLSVLTALVCHVVFKRTETKEYLNILVLLLIVPSALSALFRPYFSAWTSIPLAFATYLGTLVCSIIVYRLSPFHPLAAHPGPVLCKISKLYFALISQTGKQHFYYRQLHERYGDVVRVGPNELAFFTADAIEPMIGVTGLPKGSFWDGRLGHKQRDRRSLIASQDKRCHSARRRMWQQAFTPSSLRIHETIIEKRVAEFVDTLARNAQIVDLTGRLTCFAWDFMVDMAFGGGSTKMREGDVDGMLHLQDTIQKPIVFMTHIPWSGSLYLPLANVFPGRMQLYRRFARDCIAARVRNGSGYTDIFHHLIGEDKDKKEKRPVSELAADAILAITAGSDTTATVLSALFYFLLRNPMTYKRLQGEIDQLGDQVMGFRQQANMPYLNAALNEAMRLVPPVPEGTHRMVREPSQARTIASHYVPPGTQVFIPQYTLFRDKRYFSPLPDSFVPERWLPEDERARLEPNIFANTTEPFILNRAAFIPFSYGPANCVGKKLAWMEMRMLVCAVLRRFDLSFADGWDPQEWEDGLRGYFVVVKGKMPVVVRERIQTVP